METNSGKLARALYTNNPESKNELFFRKGEILTVIEFDFEEQAGWWLCTLRGERGLCPGNYLELLEDKYSLPVKQNRTESTQAVDLEALDYDVPRSHEVLSSSPLTKVSPLELYDFPRSELPIYGSRAVVRGNRNGSEMSLLSSSGSSNNRVSSISSASSSGQSSVSLEGPTGRLNGQYRLRNHFPTDNNTYANSQAFPNQVGSDFRPRSNSNDGPSLTKKTYEYGTRNGLMKNSIQAPEEDNGEQEYDVPRPSASAMSCSRPQSSMSTAGSGFLSLGSSESKDSLDTYDVPRSVKNCVSRFETKYDHVPARRQSTQSQTSLKRASLYSVASNGSSESSNNPGQKIEHCFGVVLRNAANLGSTTESASANGSSNNNGRTEVYDVPPSSSSSRPSSLRSWAATSVSSRLDDQSLYDIPAEFSRQVSLCGSTETLSCNEAYRHSTRTDSRGSLSRGASGSTHFGNDHSALPAEVKILPLCPKAAVSVCEKLRQEVVTSISSILNFVRPNWRVKDNLREIMPELRFSCVRLNLAINDLTDFCSRSVSNAKKLGLEALVLRLQRLLTPLSSGSHIIQKDVDELEAYFWSVDRLSVPISERAPAADALDQLVLCARSLQHDVTEIANFIALNSTALFRDDDGSLTGSSSSQAVVEPQPQVVDDGGDQEDYDYVTLAGADEVDNRSSVPPCTNPPAPVSNLDSRDQHLLEFYSAQVSTIAPLLSQSISSFISSVHQNEPPKVFNGHLKYVILLAYKMLFAGDTVHRNVGNPETKFEVESKSDELHKSVVALHEASKIATRDFPKIIPMQKIVDHVWQTTAAATQLKRVIFNACV